ncbi:MAG: L-ribulose-5-phosphate 4-epimerase [Bacteroidales bacterium]|nr:L-ribulose-5-phosphate 4-epimerase [Bacteroidales bacterium]
MLEKLKNEVCKANIDLKKSGLVIHTWGNVSGISRDDMLMVIKPSGVGYEKMKAEDMVVVDMSGNVVEGDLLPSSDAPTHLEIYKSFDSVSGIVHTHSTHATAWAQAGLDIPAMGTTHADHFYGDIPCTRRLQEEEVAEDYEKNTGKVIIETFSDLDPAMMPAVNVFDHGPFTWGTSPDNAVYNAVVLEEVARMALMTYSLKGNDKIDKYLLDKHYLRKHGKDAYYGQKDDRNNE